MCCYKAYFNEVISQNVGTLSFKKGMRVHFFLPLLVFSMKMLLRGRNGACLIMGAAVSASGIKS